MFLKCFLIFHFVFWHLLVVEDIAVFLFSERKDVNEANQCSLSNSFVFRIRICSYLVLNTTRKPAAMSKKQKTLTAFGFGKTVSYRAKYYVLYNLLESFT